MSKELIEKYGRTYWKDCVNSSMYDSFLEKVVIQNAGADLVEQLEEFSIKRNDGLEIYVPIEDIKEYIKRKSQ